MHIYYLLTLLITLKLMTPSPKLGIPEEGVVCGGLTGGLAVAIFSTVHAAFFGMHVPRHISRPISLGGGITSRK